MKVFKGSIQNKTAEHHAQPVWKEITQRLRGQLEEESKITVIHCSASYYMVAP